MIIVSIMGGLGNQLFQMSYALMISNIYNEEIFVDLSWFKKKKIRQFSLDKLLLPGNYKILNKELNFLDIFAYKIKKFAYTVFFKLFVNISHRDFLGEKVFIFLSKKGLYFNFDRYYYDFVFSKKRNKYIYGYFQSIKYFDGVNIASLFSSNIIGLVHPQKVFIDSQKSNLAISIRLGNDYMKSKELKICNEQYFMRSIKLYLEKNDNPQIFIFSDEIDRAKQMIESFNLSHKVVYVKNESDILDLDLMISCDDFIISNSSFSWWGSYLSKNDSKKIYAPSRWYNNSTRLPDIYYEKIMKVDIT